MRSQSDWYESLFPLFDDRAPALARDEAIVARAPMRWMFSGWHDTAQADGGDCTNAAITHYAYAHLRHGDDPEVFRMVSPDVGLDLRLTPDDLAEQPDADEPELLLWGAAHAARPPGGLELHVSTKGIPAATGLGTSAALEVALLSALAAAAGRRWTKLELLHAARLIETHVLGESAGFQDQGASVFGGVTTWRTRFESRDPDAPGEVAARPIDVPPVLIERLNAGLILAGFDLPHRSSEVHAEVFARRDAGDARTTAALDDLADAERRIQAALRRGDWHAFVDGLRLTWDAQRRLHDDMIPAPVRDLAEMAFGLGVHAANVNGAGMGGTLSLLADERRIGRVLQALGRVDGVRLLPCAIEPRGALVWRQPLR